MRSITHDATLSTAPRGRQRRGGAGRRSTTSKRRGVLLRAACLIRLMLLPSSGLAGARCEHRGEDDCEAAEQDADADQDDPGDRPLPLRRLERLDALPLLVLPG